jgi:toxin FitB
MIGSLHKVRPMFDERALAVSEDVMFKWRLLVADEREGQGIPTRY